MRTMTELSQFPALRLAKVLIHGIADPRVFAKALGEFGGGHDAAVLALKRAARNDVLLHELGLSGSFQVTIDPNMV